MAEINKDVQIKIEQFHFIKNEQKYIENKLNICFTTFGIVNGLISASFSIALKLSSLNTILAIMILLIPIFIGLIGLIPRNWYLMTCKNKQDKRNFYADDGIQNWNEINILDNLDYQISLAVKIIKFKTLVLFYSILSEIIVAIGLFIWMLTTQI